MRTLYSCAFALPAMTTSLACWRPSNAPYSAVVRRSGFCGVFQRSNLASRRQHTSPRTVVWATGDFFTSEVVWREFDRLNKDLATLLPMMAKFPDFDLEGKRIFMQETDAFVERFEIFNARLRLTDDPDIKGIVQKMNVQFLEANMSQESLIEGFKQYAEVLRKLLDEEERTADPVKLQALREAVRAMAPGSRLPNLSALTVDDLEAIRDPKAYAAVIEVSQNPLALEKYRDRPALYSLLKKLLYRQGA